MWKRQHAVIAVFFVGLFLAVVKERLKCSVCFVSKYDPGAVLTDIFKAP
jgi:hypothetical protein